MAKVVIVLDQEDFEDLLEVLDPGEGFLDEQELFDAVIDAPRAVVP
jgi:hypothetical protein